MREWKNKYCKKLSIVTPDSPGDILPSEAAGDTGAADGEDAVLAEGGEVGKQELMVTRPGRETLVGR